MGIGQGFKDMIERSNIPKVELIEMKRTDRLDLMRLAKVINDGRNIGKFKPENPDTFVLKHITENPYCKGQFEQIISDVIEEYGLDYNNSCFISAQKGNLKEPDGAQFVGLLIIVIQYCKINIIQENLKGVKMVSKYMMTQLLNMYGEMDGQNLDWGI